VRILDIVVAGIWIAFSVFWIAASVTTKATQTRSASSVGVRIVIIVVFVGLIHGGIFKGHSTTIDNPFLQGFGVALFLLGIGLAVWARFYLGRNWGTPMSLKVDPELVTTGPYRYVRHPIYSGILLAMIGTTLAISLYWIAAVVLFGAYFIYSARVEERNMERLFPDAYPAYKRSTKMLIPFIL